MINKKIKSIYKYIGQCGLLVVSMLTMILPVQASETLPDTLRVCASSDEMPYSNSEQQGFENALAQVLAESMSLPLEFVWSDKAAIFLVTEHLMKNECDVVMGVDTDDSRVATSEPYYKAGYVFVYRTDKDLDITSWKSPDIQKLKNIVIAPGSPSETMLKAVGKYESNFNYVKSLIGFKSIRNKYIRAKPTKLIGEIVSGNGDIAHLWAPEIARYVHNSDTDLQMVMSQQQYELENGDIVMQHYDQSIAVRLGDDALLQAINKGLASAQQKIKIILLKEGIPLL